MDQERVKKIWNGFLIFVGFWLSPLTPWNDLFVNLPIAYVFGFLLSLISHGFFLPGVVAGYWLSNIAGFLLMHYGYVQLGKEKYSFKKHRKSYLLATTLYTILVILLIHFQILPSAEQLLHQFKSKTP